MELFYKIKEDKDNSIKLTIGVTTPDIEFKNKSYLKLNNYIHYIFNVGSEKEAINIVEEFRTKWNKLDKRI